MHREETSAELGRGQIHPPDPVGAGARGTWRVTYTAGPRGVAVGGRVRITVPHGFTAPQTSAFFDPGFTTVGTEAPGVELSLEVVSMIFCRLDPETGHSGAWGRSVFVEVGGRALKDGESFALVYGNADYYGHDQASPVSGVRTACRRGARSRTAQGAGWKWRRHPFGRAGACARELSGPAEFTVAVDPDGKRRAPYSGYTRIVEQPTLQVLPGPPVGLRAIIGSDTLEGSLCQATVVSVDRYNNPVTVEQRSLHVPKGVTARISVKSGGLEARTNPTKVHTTSKLRLSRRYARPAGEELPSDASVVQYERGGASPETRIYWGDIHGHTRHSDGLGTIEAYYTYAREIGALDFSAITDHDDIGPRLADEEWELIKQGAEHFNEPGSFVTLLGFEYRNGRCDMNVYYPGPEGPLLRGTDGDLADARELTRQVKQVGGMIVPHFHFGADWSGFDPEVYRVLEIYSQHGSAEYPGCPREIPYLRKQLQKSSATNKDCFAQDALALGYPLGTTAGSDTHSARPGLSDWTRVCRTYLGGLTAIFAPELTREAVWQALHDRRCYATTGNRSLLRFTVNGSPMGSEVTVEPGSPRHVSVTCQADGELEALTIFRSGQQWVHEAVSGESIDRTFEDTGRAGSDCYYVRIDLAGGEMVWSSPIWVDPP